VALWGLLRKSLKHIACSAPRAAACSRFVGCAFFICPIYIWLVHGSNMDAQFAVPEFRTLPRPSYFECCFEFVRDSVVWFTNVFLSWDRFEQMHWRLRDGLCQRSFCTEQSSDRNLSSVRLHVQRRYLLGMFLDCVATLLKSHANIGRHCL